MKSDIHSPYTGNHSSEEEKWQFYTRRLAKTNSKDDTSEFYYLDIKNKYQKENDETVYFCSLSKANSNFRKTETILNLVVQPDIDDHSSGSYMDKLVEVARNLKTDRDVQISENVCEDLEKDEVNDSNSILVLKNVITAMHHAISKVITDQENK